MTTAPDHSENYRDSDLRQLGYQNLVDEIHRLQADRDGAYQIIAIMVNRLTDGVAFVADVDRVETWGIEVTDNRVRHGLEIRAVLASEMGMLVKEGNHVTADDIKDTTGQRTSDN